MAFDPHKNFAYSTVASAPSPATSGSTLDVASGDGSLFPDPGTDGDFNVTVWPVGELPTEANAEICRVTNISTDTFTITRTQESTSARSIQAGDQIALTITAKLLTDIEAALGGSLPDPSGEADGEVLQTSGGVAVWGTDPGGGGAGTGEDTLDTIAASGSALTVDVANGAVQDITLTANCTITLTSPAAGDAWSLTLLLRQDATGSRTVTWPGSVVWLGSGIPPILQTAAGSVDSVVLFTVDGGTTWYGVAQTSASGLRSGTSFPGSPSDGDLFYRTDRRILYEYDSTSTHWLSLNRMYVPFGPGDLNQQTTTAGNMGFLPIHEDIYIERWVTSTLVATTSGSAFWTITFNKIAAPNSATAITSFNTSADTGGNWTVHNVSVAAVVAAASFAALDIVTTKTGSPTAIRCPSYLVVRSVG